eukprot:CAMPEP_0177669802 /NCGR_PEP_ID=MMETSP0447-20121125/23681_1 /TAXON_ID=0 /ORGANISM="Stygamoeba regulata, Strain BSH-02190019" /LENGTH=107 /DNA_ID=CAMNT_0019176785 /DNA_START=17 /DNA_END=340 /DNA_ORIENTATION=+
MDSQRGVQAIMQAHHQAQQIISQAREAKVESMKRARIEAAEVVADYRHQKEQQLSAIIADEEVWKQKFHEIGEPETLATVRRLQMQAENNSKPVEEMLLKAVYTVDV